MWKKDLDSWEVVFSVERIDAVTLLMDSCSCMRAQGP